MSSAGGPGRSAKEWALHEEMMDGIMGPMCEKSRFDLWTETLKVGREYKRMAAAWFEKRREGTNWENDEDSGAVVEGINQLTAHWRRDYGTFKRWEDTFHCCLTLHLCTKLLACDRIRDRKRPSKDDKFRGIYEGNYQFRRDWVAFLSHIVAYVEGLYVSDKAGDKLYLNAERLKQMAHVYRASWWTGYDWPAIKGRIQAAQEKIEQEPPSRWERVSKMFGSGAADDSRRTVGEMLGSGTADDSRRTVGEMLGELSVMRASKW